MDLSSDRVKRIDPAILFLNTRDVELVDESELEEPLFTRDIELVDESELRAPAAEPFEDGPPSVLLDPSFEQAIAARTFASRAPVLFGLILVAFLVGAGAVFAALHFMGPTQIVLAAAAPEIVASPIAAPRVVAAPVAAPAITQLPTPDMIPTDRAVHKHHHKASAEKAHAEKPRAEKPHAVAQAKPAKTAKPTKTAPSIHPKGWVEDPFAQ